MIILPGKFWADKRAHEEAVEKMAAFLGEGSWPRKRAGWAVVRPEPAWLRKIKA